MSQNVVSRLGENYENVVKVQLIQCVTLLINHLVDSRETCKIV